MLPIGFFATTDHIPPSGSLTPTGTASATITMVATVTDNDKVAGVQFKIDGSNFGAEVTSFPFQSSSYDTHLLTNASHTFAAVVRDRVGNTVTLSNSVTIANTTPAAGDLTFDEYLVSDGGGGYVGGRTIGPAFSDRYTNDFIWASHGDKNPRNLPTNPDPTHYQMSVQMGVNSSGRIEGGTAGNVIHVMMTVDGTEYDSWANGSVFTPSLDGPVVNVAGGNAIDFYKWETIPGTNTSFTAGVIAHYTFSIKAGYLS